MSLDALHWRAGWSPMPKQEWADTVARLAAQPRWIMDGNFGGTLDLRLAACDTVIFLDLPAWLCLWRVLKRRIANHGRPRPGMAEGCAEKLDADFLAWIATFRRRRRPALLAKLRALRADQRAVVLRSRKEVAAFLEARRAG